MGNRKWPNDSLKTQANLIRKRYKEEGKPIPTDPEILQIFIQQGKIKAVGDTFEKPPPEMPKWPSNPEINSIPKKLPPEDRSKKSSQKQKSTSDPDLEILNKDELKELFKEMEIPEGLKQAIGMVKVGQSLGVDLKLADLKPFITQSKTIIPFIDVRPDHNLLYMPVKQRELYSAIKRGQHVIVVGIRGTAKTETIEQALASTLLEREGVKIHHFCGKVDTAIANLKEIKNWLYDRGLPENNEIIPENNEHTLTLCTKSTMKAHANTQADIRKYRGDINWVDEAQLMKADAFRAMLGLFSGVNSFQLIASGNFGEITGESFENFCRSEERAQVCAEMNIAYFEFTEADIYWTSQESKSGLRKLMEITVGVQGAASQLDPIWITPEGAKYDSVWIQDAFKSFYFPTRMQKVVAGMDWGDNGTTTIVVLGLGSDNHIYVLYTWAKKGATTSDVAERIWFCWTEFGAEFAWEASPSGDYARKDIREKYGTEILFHDSLFTKQKEKFIYYIYRYLSIRMLHFIDQLRETSIDPLDLPYTKQELTELQIMRTEFERYCGDKKQDHRHDALAHALHYIISTTKGIVEFIEKTYKEKGAAVNV